MADPTPPTDKELRNAFKAFKKRLKLTQLDEDSKMTRSPTTSGGSSSIVAIVAIVPPNEFGRAVWDELVKQGKLKKAGQGMYEMVEWWTL